MAATRRGSGGLQGRVGRRHGSASCATHASGLEAFAASIGAPSTQISHTFGCGTPANDTTLTDLSTMTQQSGLPAGLSDLIAEEAAAAGKPGIVSNTMRNGRQQPQRREGRVRAHADPVQVRWVVVQRAFSYGHFYNCAPCKNDDAATDAYAKASIEKYRSAIRSAIATW